tara:strand:+ start:65 stop:481 length:417 start_codon:yes stop_codon:yes gene_type:complete
MELPAVSLWISANPNQLRIGSFVRPNRTPPRSSTPQTLMRTNASNGTDLDVLLVCPPAAPPPAAPPDLRDWSQQVPGWFWVMFVMTTLMSAVSMASFAYTLHGMNRARRGDVALGRRRGTATALAQLESQVSRLTGGL